MKLSKRITSIALAMIMILSTSSVFAADYDLKISETGESKSFLDWIFDDAVFLDVMYSEGKYLIECGGKYYKAEDVIEKSTANPNAELDELVKDLEPVAEEPDELKVVSVSAINLKELEVTFNKPVTKSTAETIGNYQLNGTALTSSDIESTDGIKLSKDGKKVTINFVAGKLANKTYYNFEIKGVKDAEGKEVEYAELLYVNDTVAPTVKDSKYTLAESEFVINFSEPLAAGTDRKVKVYDENNADVTASIVSPSTITDKIVIDTTSLAPKKTYKVVILGATDLAGNYFANNRVELEFTTDSDDDVKPTVVDMVAKDQKTIRVTFSEPIFVDSSASDKIAEILVDGKDLGGTGSTATNVVVGALGTAGNAAMVDNNPAVWDITLNTSALTGAKKISLVNFVDLSKNKQETAYEKWVTFTADETAPKLVSSKTEGDKLYLTFDEDITVTVGGNVTVLYNYVEKTYKSAATAGTADVGVKTTSDAKVVEIDLANAVKESGNYEITIAKGILADASTNSEEYKITKDFTIADTEKPELTNGVADIVQTANKPSEVKITFNKDLDPATALDVNNYKANGQVVFSSAVFEGAQNVIRFTVKPGAFDVDGDYLFEISNVKSKAGVEMKDFSGLKTGIKENVAPAVAKAELAAVNKITVTFSEDVKYSADPFEVYVDGKKVEIKAIAAETTTAKGSIEIELETELTDVTKPITVKVVDDAVITDGNGNELVTGGTTTVAID